MTFVEFRELLNHIQKHHRFGRGGKGIKYVEPTIDMRTGDVFCVSIRGWNDRTFSKTNENSDRDLKKWIYEWLGEDCD